MQSFEVREVVPHVDLATPLRCNQPASRRFSPYCVRRHRFKTELLLAFVPSSQAVPHSCMSIIPVLSIIYSIAAKLVKSEKRKARWCIVVRVARVMR